MEQRHIPNDFSSLLTLSSEPEQLLLTSLQRILNTSPPQSTYTKSQLHGLFTGHTGIAYLFLHISSSLPQLRIHGYPAIHWARAYISGDRGRLALEPGNCGLACERLAHPAVRACITKDLKDVRDFLAPFPDIIGPLPRHTATRPTSSTGKQGGESDPFPSELVYGRAGALYLLRLVRHWVPTSAPLVERYVVHLTDRILATDDGGAGNWLWSGTHYLGAAHGDIGILTQLVLTTPPLAPRLTHRLERLLDLQFEDGNWPSSVQPPPPPGAGTTVKKKKKELVQWCHGAPGFVLSLLSLRPFFPSLKHRIDAAIEKGRAITWDHGLLRKEPSLCHGILGNALIFPPGPEREHFLALATPDKVTEARRADPSIFRPASYGKDTMLLMNYDPSAAWTGLVCERKLPKMILYNDI
ncbi:abscisic acid ABA receptor [Sodiomyces alkalinus F11]|uniref:Abscisic acid ABA receptor n=1 Tax=Sodiomyces alkalinus (strain CBS 110278 / VKM F-3762 / F11) TaxID=1314773 RepID=A0A3N2PT22_SODAK|nr:abscisic acid ABA receptor [Sodiomyces alkalinus F11]ROT37657.1 abscisic acid ABA receptor [Sodiomyces alkalinus F11]